MQQSLQRLVEAKQLPTSQEVRCVRCQVRMSRRGKRQKRVVTVRGEVTIQRAYYVCPKCAATRFPPG